MTNKHLCSFDISEDDKFIQKVEPNKVCGQNNIRFRMMKIRGKLICKPLCKIFEGCLRTGTFLLEWKRGNIVPVIKKRDK